MIYDDTWLPLTNSTLKKTNILITEFLDKNFLWEIRIYL